MFLNSNPEYGVWLPNHSRALCWEPYLEVCGRNLLFCCNSGHLADRVHGLGVPSCGVLVTPEEDLRNYGVYSGFPYLGNFVQKHPRLFLVEKLEEPLVPREIWTSCGDHGGSKLRNPQHQDSDVGTRPYMGGCQNYGPFLGPYYSTAPNI